MKNLRLGWRTLEALPAIGVLFRLIGTVARRILVFFLHLGEKLRWQRRIRVVVNSPDNAFIPRVADAGTIHDGYQVMHNGIKILTGSYYGAAMSELLRQNRGVHEPQEERVFQEVLKQLPTNAVMLELGAYWAFYSMWFHQAIKDAVCYLIEPMPQYMAYGEQNFALNKMRGHFAAYRIGAHSEAATTGVPMISVDDFVAQHGIEHLHILHADIQGAEFAMLNGAQRTFDAEKIDYLFLSTHSNALHRQCVDFLKARNFIIIADANPDASYSFDGVLVAHHPRVAMPTMINISQR